MITTWNKEIALEMSRYDETMDDVVGKTKFDGDRKFYDGYGSSEGEPFTLWTKDRVYFPGVYDGAEWVSSVPRNPCDEATSHIGGQ